MRKKGTGKGNIYYKADRNKWMVQYAEYNSIEDKNSRKSKTFDTEDEAREFLDRIMYEKQNQNYIKENGFPLDQLMKLNVENKHNANLISDVQYERVLRSQRVILNQAPFSNKDITEITSDEIQDFLNACSEKYSNSSIKKIKEQIGQAFTYAFNKGYIERNPMIEVIRPKSRQKDKVVRALTIDEQEKFVDFLLKQDAEKYPYRNVFLMQMFMGFRIGEVLALKTSDIDLKHQAIKVDKTLSTDADGYIFMSDSPKTEAGNRVLPIPKVLMPFVMEQMQIAKNKENNDEELLFKPPQNRYTDRENVNRALKRALSKFDITGISTHSLRHTYATRSIEAGMSAVVLQKLMGHTDVSVTLNAYTSVFDKYKKDELQKVNEYYQSQNLLNSNAELLKLDSLDNTKSNDEVKEIQEGYER